MRDVRRDHENAEDALAGTALSSRDSAR